MTRPKAVTPHTTVIIGAGFAGLGTAIRLLQSGIEDFVILERGSRVGGTWRDNTYPGAACDIPSLLYSYSFALNPEWSRGYSGSAEILGYIDHMVERFGLLRFIRFHTTVTAATFDAAAGVWNVETEDGTAYRGRTAVMAAGPLANASLPDIRGIDTFTGVKIHSARWDHSYDFAGKRVAVVGTGASAVQIIPELAGVAAQLTVYQRTPGWVIPRTDYRTPWWTKQLYRRMPTAQRAAREGLFWVHETMALGMVWSTPLTRVIEQIAGAHLRRQVRDPWLRRQLTPDFRAGCKRMLVSNDYYPALQRPNSKLVTWPIATISPDGIRTSDGIERQFDAIVFATGFDITKTGTPFPITGLDGRLLADEWRHGAQAYKSVNVSGYPNLFFTFGPNSGPGHNSALVYMESQIEYIVRATKTIVDRELLMLDVRGHVQHQYNVRMQERLKHTTWNSGCRSWYLTDDGFNGAMYPGFATQYARQMGELRLADYVVTARSGKRSDDTEHVVELPRRRLPAVRTLERTRNARVPHR
ncbi:NAD(P)/FAD-dependent oxidoreductase [Jatrophihabitans sp.]|uniref:flavin-containing monooxygenase n=1 Tax=Jatrophihabitans sp. TaxID=1932789 RepID=UPI0030C6C20E|nr:dependent oxidoreductase [Jatrophihabitans sp.]